MIVGNRTRAGAGPPSRREKTSSIPGTRRRLRRKRACSRAKRT